MCLFLGSFEFSPLFGKIEILTFSKIYLLIKNSESLSAYSSYECIQLKNTTFTINAIGNSAKTFEILLGVLWGKLTLEPPHKLPETFFWQTQVILDPLG